jgi:hypothetical protein
VSSEKALSYYSILPGKSSLGLPFFFLAMYNEYSWVPSVVKGECRNSFY